MDTYTEHVFDPNAKFVVNECGHFKIIKMADYARRRPCGRKDYQLLYIVGGRAWFTIDGEDIPATVGDFIVYTPGYPQYYHYSLKDNTDIYWMHFYGTEVVEVLNQLNIKPNRVIRSTMDSYITKKWNQMIQELTLKQRGFDTLLPLYAQEIMTMLFRNRKPLNTTQMKSQKIIMDAIEYISNEFDHSINVQDLARHLGVSACWLNLNFRLFTGTSPLQYIINARLSHAMELLRFSDYTINEIARICGYEDALYFSRLFKKHVGGSPREYRQNRAGGTNYDLEKMKDGYIFYGKR